ncbi:MAG TPA: ATP-binding protein [Vicinamibacterales bacterium]|nr:ATP-binding protein [Vicinamibacterales bacterium]
MPRFLRWSTYRFRTKLLIVVALPLLPLAAFWSITAVTLYRQSTPGNNASRNLVVQAALAHVYSTLLDADAGVRDFVLTENPDAEARYEEAVARLPATLGALDSAVIDPAQRSSLTALNAKVAEELALLTRLPARSIPGEPFFSERGAFDRSKALLDDVRTIVITMERRQASLAETHVESTERAESVLFMILLAGSIVCAAGGVMAALVVAGSVSRRIGRLARTADQLAQGEAIEAGPAGKDEIDQLDQRFHEAACLLRERENELRARTEELETANRELEAFSYSVSHDLRAPLRAIDGYARILEEDHGAGLDDEGRRMLKSVRSAGQQMGRLIDDLLHFSRVNRAEVRRWRVDMAELAREAATQPGAETRALIEFEDLPPASGDRALLKQVWVNLVSNAVKYSGKRERPLVRIGGHREGGETVYWVRDNGVGFDMRYAAKLFGVFQRLHSAEEFPGTGVGLAIVQRVVVRHGGRVWAESRPGEGACFFFSLPREAA